MQGQLLAAKGDREFAFEDAERFFEVVAMRRRPAARRDVHVDSTEAATRVAAGHKKSVGISDNADVREVLVCVGLREGELALKVIGRNRRIVVHRGGCSLLWCWPGRRITIAAAGLRKARLCRWPTDGVRV